MGRNHTVVMIGRGNHSCRILAPKFQIVQRRVTFQVVKHLLAVIARTIITCPIPANGEFVIAEHIHHSYLRNGHTEEVRTLCHASAHQQTTVRTAYDSNLIFIGILTINEVFGCRDKVIEYILFLHLRTCHVPLFTIFATTAQVCLCIDTAIFQKRNT